MFLSWLQLHNKHRWFHSGSPSMGLPAFLDCVTWPLQVVAREARASVGPFRLVARHRGLFLSASGVRDLWSMSKSGHASRQHSGFLPLGSQPGPEVGPANLEWHMNWVRFTIQNEIIKVFCPYSEIFGNKNCLSHRARKYLKSSNIFP